MFLSLGETVKGIHEGSMSFYGRSRAVVINVGVMGGGWRVALSGAILPLIFR